MVTQAQPAEAGVPYAGHLGFAAFANEDVSARAARKWAHALLEVWLVEDKVDDIDVMVSELVTNAHLHTTSPAIWVRITCSGGLLTVEVADDGSGDWELTDPSRDGGQGLKIVKNLADEWGTNPLCGNTVWFEMKTAGHVL